MKLLIVLFFVAAIQVNAKGYGQQISLSEKNISLDQLFRKIEKQTNYNFAFTGSQLSAAKKVSIKVTNVPLEKVLQICFSGQPFTYTIIEKTIIVKPKPKRGVVVENIEEVAFIDIHGKVVTVDGSVLKGATIKVKGKEIGTFTDENGAFILSGVSVGNILEISYVGFETKEVRVDNRATYFIQLEYKLTNLDEMIIQGYGKEKRRNLIGSITKISSKDFENQPVSNILSAIQGLAPGLDLTNSSGTPGSSVSLRLRGINTMNDVTTTSVNGSGSVALIIVDGVPVTSLSFISPTDIESVEILRDASATAIYGSRAASGVILVTTKRGQMGTQKGKINFQAYTSIATPTHLPEMLNTDQYRMLRKEGYKNDGIAYNQYSAPDLFLDSSVNTNWGENLYKKALTQDYQLNFSGGSSNISYFVSGGYRNEDAIVKGDWFSRRINTHAGLDAKVSERLTIGATLGYSKNNSNLYNQSGFPSAVYYALPNIPMEIEGETNLTEYYPNVNPNRILTAFTEASGSQLLGNFNFNFNILPRFYLRTDIGYQQSTSDYTAFSPSKSYNYDGVNARGTYGSGNTNNVIIEPQFNYTFSVKNNPVKLLAGATYINNQGNSTSLNFQGYASELLNTLASPTQFISKTYSEAQYKFASVFGRASYNYGEKYLFEGAFRRDGSSRFGENYRYGNFFSLGGGWVFSKESFFQNFFGADFFGKLKTTYGITGNDNIGNFGYLSYSSTGRYGDNSTAYYVANLSNPFLKWERTKKVNFGMEFSMLKNRLNFSIDYYRHITEGTLFVKPLSVVTGYNSIRTNLEGEVANNGVEFSIVGEPVISKDFKWSTQFNVSFNKNKLLSLPGLTELGNLYKYTYKVGEPLALNWGFKYTGVDPATGLAVFEDVDKNGNIDYYTEDHQVIGKSIPDFYGGWKNSFTYKNWGLDIMAQFVSGILKEYNIYSGIGSPYNLPVTALSRWQKPGDVTDIPRAAAPGSLAAMNNDKIASSSFAFSDASYIRLKNITLNYTIPHIPKLGMSDLGLFLTTYNLFTITNYKGDDPENGASYVPMTKIFTIGLKLGL